MALLYVAHKTLLCWTPHLLPSKQGASYWYAPSKSAPAMGIDKDPRALSTRDAVISLSQCNVDSLRCLLNYLLSVAIRQSQTRSLVWDWQVNKLSHSDCSACPAAAVRVRCKS